MANSVNVYDESYTAFGDLRSNQFYIVEFVVGSDQVVQKTSAVTAVACGVLQNNPNSGELAAVRHLGRSKIVVGCVSVSSAGYLIGPAAHGAADVKLNPVADSGEYFIAQSIEAAVTSGSVVMALLYGPVPL